MDTFVYENPQTGVEHSFPLPLKDVPSEISKSPREWIEPPPYKRESKMILFQRLTKKIFISNLNQIQMMKWQ